MSEQYGPVFGAVRRMNAAAAMTAERAADPPVDSFRQARDSGAIRWRPDRWFTGRDREVVEALAGMGAQPVGCRRIGCCELVRGTRERCLRERGDRLAQLERDRDISDVTIEMPAGVEIVRVPL